MRFNLERVKANVQAATTEDLLDRVTVYREGMEPRALDVIERELAARGVTRADIEAHAGARPTLEGDVPPTCSFCHRPAIGERRGWHRLFWLIPFFPRVLRYCEEHQPGR